MILICLVQIKHSVITIKNADYGLAQYDICPKIVTYCFTVGARKEYVFDNAYYTLISIFISEPYMG